MKTTALYYILFISLFFTCNSDNTNIIVQEEEEEEEEVIILSELQTIALENPNEPTWVAKENMKSRNGDTMGYGVILNPNSDKLLISLDGGGACYNPITCNGNLDAYTAANFENDFSVTNALIFNRNATENQFKDWNVVFIPYATGDVHSGSNPSANVPFNGPTAQVMTGYNNITIVLNDLKTYFDTLSNPLTEAVFSGSSAGGFGTLFNTTQFATIFGTNIQATILVDSGQLFLGTDILTSCLETQWQDLWLLYNNFPADLNTVVPNGYDFDIQKIYDYLAITYPNFNFGFLSTYEDQVIRGYYSFGLNNCPALPTQLVSGITFKNGLLDLKTNVFDTHNNWKVFYTNGISHTFLGNPTLSQTANGVALNQWILDLRQGHALDEMD